MCGAIPGSRPDAPPLDVTVPADRCRAPAGGAGLPEQAAFLV